MKKRYQRVLSLFLSLTLLMGCISLGGVSASAEENPFAGQKKEFTNENFAFPGAPEKWTLDTYKTKSLGIHDTEIYYEDGTYYAYITNDTNVYSSTDMLNWTITGSKPRGWYSSGESMYVTWAPQLIKLNKPYVLDGEEYPYALWDSLSELGSQNSRIRCFVSKTPSPTEANGAGFRYVGDVMCSGKYAAESPTNVIESFEGTYNGKAAQYFQVEGYSTASSATNANGWNAIDSMVLYDQDGKMWMSWGSWFGGIFICELDENTLMPKSNQASDYTRIAYRSSGGIEGPTILYHDGYYYLNVAYGNLNNAYNTRIGRSASIDGPYLDYNGNPMTNSSTYTGTKIAAPYSFGSDRGWLAQGHAAWVYNPDTDQYFMTSNGRPVGNSGTARMMVRSVLWTEDGWPVVSPELVTGDTTKTLYGEDSAPLGCDVSAYQTIPTSKVPGAYEVVFFTRGTDSTTATASKTIVLLEDGTVSGDYTGYWAQVGETNLKLQLDGVTYNAALTASYDWEKGKSGVLCFSAISQAGAYDDNRYGAVLWGKQVYVSSPEELVAEAIASVSLPTETKRDVTLPTNYNGVEISWASDNEAVLNPQGVINRQTEDVTVTLTATFQYQAVTETRTYSVVVSLRPTIPALDVEPVVYLPFDGDLSVQSTNGTKVQAANGTYTYGDGVYGQAVTIGYVSGGGGLNSAIRLSNGALNNPSEFTVSMWVKPTALSAHVATFFSRGKNKWTSMVPSLYGSGAAGSRICDDSAGSSAWYDADTGVKLSADTWSLLTYTYQDGVVSYYVDGELKATVKDAVNPIDNGASQTFYIGANEWDGVFQGAIDDFYLFDQALDADQIDLLKNKAAFQVYHQYGDAEPELDEAQSLSGLLAGSAIKAQAVPKEGYLFSELVVEGITYEEEDAFDPTNPSFADLMRTNDVKVTYKYLPTLVADMRFDGNTLDQSGASLLYTGSGSNTGTLTYEAGIQGQAVRMPAVSGNALNSVIRLKDGLLGQTDAFTISMWVKPDELKGHVATFFSRAGSRGVNNKWMSVVPHLYDTNTAGVRICDDNQGNWYDTNGSVKLSVGEWSMLTYTFDNGSTAFYVDGVKVGEIASGASNPMSGGASQTFYIGGNQWDGAFNGLIDTFQLYRDALSAEKVAELYIAQGPQLTVEDVAARIESGEWTVTVEKNDDGVATKVVPPTVEGFAVSITASSNPDVVALDGTVSPATTDTTVTLTLTVQQGAASADAVVSVQIDGNADTSDLEQAIEKAEALLANLEDYTLETAEALKTAYEKAVDLLNDQSATQAMLDEACLALTDALDALISNVNEYMVRSGEKVEIALQVKDIQDMAAIQGTLNYDPALLTLTEIKPMEGFLLQYKQAENGTISLVVMTEDGTGVDGDVTFATAVFTTATVESATETKVVVDGDIYASDISLLPNRVATSIITIVAGIKGDVNFDGVVNVADVLMALQYTSGNRQLSKSEWFAADYNSDGDVTVADVMLILNAASS